MVTLITILIPTYEPQPAYLRAAVESALAQTYRDWTMLIHDDASHVDVESIIQPYLTDPRITYYRSATRLGIGGNWNACLHRADAPFVQFLFQDDTWEPAYLASSIAALTQNAQAVFCASNHRYADAADKPAGGSYEAVRRARDVRLQPGLQPGHDFLLQWLEDGLHPNLIGEPSFVLLRRSVAQKAGAFAQDLPQCLDTEYWTRLLLLGDWYWVAENLGTFRVHNAGASSVNQQSGIGMMDRLLCLHRIGAKLSGGDRRRARGAIRRSVDVMVQRYLQRATDGQAAARGAWRKIPMRYYPMLAVSVMRHMIERKSDSGDVGSP